MSRTDQMENFGAEMYDLTFQHIGPHTVCKAADCDFAIDTGATSHAQAQVLQLARAHRAVCG